MAGPAKLRCAELQRAPTFPFTPVLPRNTSAIRLTATGLRAGDDVDAKPPERNGLPLQLLDPPLPPLRLEPFPAPSACPCTSLSWPSRRVAEQRLDRR